MTQKHASSMLVTASCLPDYLEAFREYVEKYFVPVTFGGVAFFHAFLDIEGHKEHCSSRKTKGVAPSHNNYLRAKVSNGHDLYDWIAEKVRDKTQTDIVHVSCFWDDGTLTDWGSVD